MLSVTLSRTRSMTPTIRFVATVAQSSGDAPPDGADMAGTLPSAASAAEGSVPAMSAPSGGASPEDWATVATNRIVGVIDLVRDKVTDNIQLVAKWVVY